MKLQATPLAVPEKRGGLPRFLAFFDRGANALSLYPAQRALASVARHTVLERLSREERGNK